MFIGVRVKCPATGVTDSCELPYGCWELNSGPLEEQPVLLTTEPSLQPQILVLACLLTPVDHGIPPEYTKVSYSKSINS